MKTTHQKRAGLGRDVFQEIDFAGLWREQSQRSSFGPRSSQDWDRRARQRFRRELNSDYSRAFLRRLDLSGVNTALDIGCGTGNLAIPLAKRLRRVHALDFSNAMLRELDNHRRREGLENIALHERSWFDSWRAVPKVDLVLCSRAMGVEDLRAALDKMSRKARRRAYATIHSGGSYLGNDVLALLDREIVPRPDYIYAVNILYQMGYRARVDFLRSSGGQGYASEDEFLRAVRWRIGELSAKEEARLRRFFRTLPREDDGSIRYRHDFEWAMLAWETGGA